MMRKRSSRIISNAKPYSESANLPPIEMRWRRGELNPRPKIFKNWPLHAYSAIWSLPSGRPRTGCHRAQPI